MTELVELDFRKAGYRTQNNFTKHLDNWNVALCK
jgi:hypothetical protein